MPALSLWGHKPGLSSLIGVSGSMVSGTFEGTFEARNSGFLNEIGLNDQRRIPLGARGRARDGAVRAG